MWPEVISTTSGLKMEKLCSRDSAPLSVSLFRQYLGAVTCGFWLPQFAILLFYVRCLRLTWHTCPVPDSFTSLFVGGGTAYLLREPCKLLSSSTATFKSFDNKSFVSSVTIKFPHSNLASICISNGQPLELRQYYIRLFATAFVWCWVELCIQWH